MPAPVTPRVRILERLKAVLENPANDLVGKSGVADITVRHARNRWANPDEAPSLTIRFVSDTLETENYHTAWEALRYLALDLIVDTELATEDSDMDPTGLERPGAIANAALAILKDETAEDGDGNTLRDLCNDVVDEGVNPDEDNEADEARFIQRIVVIYRTSITDPNRLLAQGENLT
jgi:hypothetical protein